MKKKPLILDPPRERLRPDLRVRLQVAALLYTDQLAAVYADCAAVDPAGTLDELRYLAEDAASGFGARELLRSLGLPTKRPTPTPTTATLDAEWEARKSALLARLTPTTEKGVTGPGGAA